MTDSDKKTMDNKSDDNRYDVKTYNIKFHYKLPDNKFTHGINFDYENELDIILPNKIFTLTTGVFVGYNVIGRTRAKMYGVKDMSYEKYHIKNWRLVKETLVARDVKEFVKITYPISSPIKFYSIAVLFANGGQIYSYIKNKVFQ